MQGSDLFLRSCVFLPREAFFKYISIFFISVWYADTWADLDNLALFLFFNVTYIPHEHTHTAGWFISYFFIKAAKFKPLWASKDVVKGKRRMQVIVPPHPLIFRFLSNRCSIFTRKSCRGIRFEDMGKMIWQIHLPLLSTILLASDIIRCWYVCKHGAREHKEKGWGGVRAQEPILLMTKPRK